MVKARITNKNSVKASMRKVNQRVIDATEKQLVKELVELDALAKRKISSGLRSGKVYKRRSIEHKASAPGEFPKTDTGALISGFFFNVKRKALNLRGMFANNSPHASYLEFKPRMQGGRPFMRPLFESTKDAIKNNVIISVKREIKKHGR